jgi:hypothetical protein
MFLGLNSLLSQQAAGNLTQERLKIQVLFQKYFVIFVYFVVEKIKLLTAKCRLCQNNILLSVFQPPKKF